MGASRPLPPFALPASQVSNVADTCRSVANWAERQHLRLLNATQKFHVDWIPNLHDVTGYVRFKCSS